MTIDYDPIAIALIVARHPDALGVTYTVGGAIASSFAGEPRTTLDIDIVAAFQDDIEDWFHRNTGKGAPTTSRRLQRMPRR